MLEKIKKNLSAILIFSSILEVIFFFSLENIWAVTVLLIGWYVLKENILTKKNMNQFPISFLMCFGLALFHYILPIPLTLLEFKPVTFNLLLPFETFLHHLLFILVIVMTHFIYRRAVKNKNPLRNILSKTIFYIPPSNRLIIITGIIGLSFSFYFYFIYGAWENYGEKNIILTLLQPVTLFLWMPIIIPFFKVRGINGKLTLNMKYFIIIYSLLVIVISIISNWRTILYYGIMIFISLYFIGVLYEYYNVKRLFKTKTIILILVLFYFISGPLMDLGVAMVITRQSRYSTISSDFLKTTLEIYNDKEALYKFSTTMVQNDKAQYIIKSWDEHYLNNYFFNRYCNLKISDNCLYYANKIGFANTDMQNVLIDQILTFIPGGIANMLEIKTSARKEEYRSSITDNLYSMAIRDSNVKGSAIIGSIPGVGLSIFGYWYLIVIMPIFIIIFTMFDSFAYVFKNKVHFSYYFFTMVIIIINYFNDRHVYTFEFRWIFRNYIESIILFLIIYQIARMIEKLHINKIKN
jgi:hypothetical protein